MARLRDARGNEVTGDILDQIGGGTIDDTRNATGVLSELNSTWGVDINSHSCVIFKFFCEVSVFGDFIFEGTVDGFNYYRLPARQFPFVGSILVSIVTTASAINTSYLVECTGFRRVRVRRIEAEARQNMFITAYAVSPSRILNESQRPNTLRNVTVAAQGADATFDTGATPVSMYTYVTHVQLYKLYAVLGVGTTSQTITVSDLVGDPAWLTSHTAQPAGTVHKVIDVQWTQPIRSKERTSVTFTATGQAQTIWRWNVHWYFGA